MFLIINGKNYLLNSSEFDPKNPFEFDVALGHVAKCIEEDDFCNPLYWKYIDSVLLSPQYEDLFNRVRDYKRKYAYFGMPFEKIAADLDIPFDDPLLSVVYDNSSMSYDPVELNDLRFFRQ